MASMGATSADLQVVKQFAAQTTRAVLVTRRKDGGLQSSPMAVVADDDGNVLTATRARSAKTCNLARDPRVMLCLFTERWPGPWLHVHTRTTAVFDPNRCLGVQYWLPDRFRHAVARSATTRLIHRKPT
jgi:PPOX class probable F420-dependent enzyme